MRVYFIGYHYTGENNIMKQFLIRPPLQEGDTGGFSKGENIWNLFS